MPEPQSAELTRFLNQKVCLWVNRRRKTEGTLTGFDNTMNLVLEDTVEVTKEGEQKKMGQVVIRGKSVEMLQVMVDACTVQSVTTSQVPVQILK